MLLKSFIVFVISINNFFCNCHKDIKRSGFNKGKNFIVIKSKGKLDNIINESSGLVIADSVSLFTINDGGGKEEIYNIDFSGQLIKRILIPYTSNHDWEEISKDDYGNIYIGDFGNNLNNRNDLRIFKISKDFKTVDTIQYKYGDQLEYPPDKKQKNFDCEAFFWKNDSLLLFSKNRGDKFVKIYKLPAKNGTFKAKLIRKIYMNAMITGASFCPESGLIALLGYGKVYILKVDDNLKNIVPLYCSKFKKSLQAEGIAFIKKNQLFITNEQGNLYEMIIK